MFKNRRYVQSRCSIFVIIFPAPRTSSSSSQKIRTSSQNNEANVSFFKDNNVHKFPTHQPPLKTSGPPFSATSAPFLRFLSSPLAPWSAQNGENPRVCFPFPEPTHPLPEPDKTHPVTTYRFLAFRKKKGGTEFTAGILVHGGAAFLKRFPGISVTPTTTVPRRFR